MILNTEDLSLGTPALGGEQRQKTRAFSELQSHYLFAAKFGRPAKGNDNGKVEGLLGYASQLHGADSALPQLGSVAHLLG
jgi:transposase